MSLSAGNIWTTSLFAEKLNIAVIGGGPSGLLLSHLLLRDDDIKVSIFESRDDPRIKGAEQRAYALGLGIRGRTAIRQVDEELWQAIRERGYESERFQLHIGGFVIPLRSEKDGNPDNGSEPSVLIYQSELCAGLIDELERRHGKNDRLEMKFGTRVISCDLKAMEVTSESDSQTFDLIIGCDGVNSIVRNSMSEAFQAFESSMQDLPGNFKVIRMNEIPPNVDPKAVSLILPRKGSTSAFVEPTGKDGSCCILFAGRDDASILKETSNVTAVEEELIQAFPEWKGFHNSIAEGLVSQTAPGIASSVVCNIYNFGGKSVLAGDACHATGGVSGQGVNSALVDSAVLADCIAQYRDDMSTALLEYSVRQVPEGKALYDLSFGPKPKGMKGLIWAARSARDTLFRGRFGIGRPPLQTRLTTDLSSFASIRREVDKFYEDLFPSDEDFRRRLSSLHKSAMRMTPPRSLAK